MAEERTAHGPVLGASGDGGAAAATAVPAQANADDREDACRQRLPPGSVQCVSRSGGQVCYAHQGRGVTRWGRPPRAGEAPTAATAAPLQKGHQHRTQFGVCYPPSSWPSKRPSSRVVVSAGGGGTTQPQLYGGAAAAAAARPDQSAEELHHHPPPVPPHTRLCVCSGSSGDGDSGEAREGRVGGEVPEQLLARFAEWGGREVPPTTQRKYVSWVRRIIERGHDEFGLATGTWLRNACEAVKANQLNTSGLPHAALQKWLTFLNSRYRGVYWDHHKWRAEFSHSGKRVYVGHFEDEVEAAKAWDAAVRKVGRQDMNFARDQREEEEIVEETEEEEEEEEEDLLYGAAQGLQKCETCLQPHGGSYGSGRFCGVRCSTRYATIRRLRENAKTQAKEKTERRGEVLKNRGSRRKKSRFKGVYWKQNKWFAQLYRAGRFMCIGRFTTEVDAAKAWDAAAQKVGRRDLNFKPAGAGRHVAKRGRIEQVGLGTLASSTARGREDSGASDASQTSRYQHREAVDAVAGLPDQVFGLLHSLLNASTHANAGKFLAAVKARRELLEGEQQSRSRSCTFWTAAEDSRLIELVDQCGEGDWTAKAALLGTERTALACSSRYANYLRARVRSDRRHRQANMRQHSSASRSRQGDSTAAPCYLALGQNGVLPAATDDDSPSFQSGNFKRTGRQHPQASVQQNNSVPARFPLNSRVSVQFARPARWFDGQVVKVLTARRFRVHFDDGEFHDVHSDKIKLRSKRTQMIVTSPQCSVCMNQFGSMSDRQVFKLPCNHSFCANCIESWCCEPSRSGRPTCPECRQAFVSLRHCPSSSADSVVTQAQLAKKEEKTAQVKRRLAKEGLDDVKSVKTRKTKRSGRTDPSHVMNKNIRVKWYVRKDGDTELLTESAQRKTKNKGKFYTGSVVKYDEIEKLYVVKFDDGDFKLNLTQKGRSDYIPPTSWKLA
eukprot:COSAG01_NODE_6032_length_3889_cov_5.695251_1_plen_950_part_00